MQETVLEARFKATPVAPAEARRALEGWRDVLEGELLFSLRLLVTEVISNAVKYGSLGDDEWITLRVERTASRTRAVVADSSGGFETWLPVPSTDEVGGRGLFLVHRIADRWGIEQGEPFHVWFELDADSSRWAHPPAV